MHKFQQNPWTTFRVGLFAGIFSVLVVVIIVAGKLLYEHITALVKKYLLNVHVCFKMCQIRDFF